jgi:MFS transporter, PPP family, 3-phenylpropionic acid transporter
MPPRLITLRLYYFTSFAALGAYFPYLPRWLEAQGIEGIRMGIISAIIPAMSVLGPPFFGFIADTLGLRGALLRIACFGSCVCFGAVAAAGAFGRPFGFGALFCAVLGFALFRSPMVMMADVVALEQAPAAGTTYPRIRLWGSLGFLVAALAVGRWVDPRDPVPVPLITAAALLVAFLAAWKLPARAAPPTIPVASHARGLIGDSSFRLFLGISLLAQVAHSNYDLCFSLHLRDLGWRDDLVGVAWSVAVVAEITLMAVCARILGRIEPTRLIAIAMVGAAVRWAMIATVRSPVLLLSLQPLHLFSFTLWWIASLAYIKDRAPAAALSTAQGLFTAAAAAGSVLGMLSWGALYRRAGGGVTFATASLVSAVAFGGALVWARRTRSGAPLIPVPVVGSRGMLERTP